MSRRREILQLAAQRQERERQAGVKMGYGENAYSAYSTRWVMPPIPIGTEDFSIEFHGNFYGSSTAGVNGISNMSQPVVYKKGCLMMYATVLGYNRMGWILFEGTEADGLAVQHDESDRQKKFHFVLTRSGRTVKAYINGVLKVTKEQSSVKDFPDFRLGLANSSDIGLARLFNYALSAAEVAALYNGGRPEGFMLGENLKIWDKYLYAFANTTQYNINSNHDIDRPVVKSTDVDKNGFSGEFFRVESIDKYGRLSLYDILSFPPVKKIGAVYRVIFKYRSNSKVSSIALNKTFDANIGDAITIVTDLPVRYVSSSRPFSPLLDAAVSQNIIDGTDKCWIEFQMISVQQVGCIAEYLPQNLVAVDGIGKTWLDSARQLPVNDEYLPPLLESAGGYDLEANGNPEIIYKPTLTQYWQMNEPMTLEGVSLIVPGYKVAPEIVEGAIRITSNETTNSYGGGVKLINTLRIKPGDCYELSFEARGFGEFDRAFIVIAGSGGNFWYSHYPILTSEYQQFVYSGISTYSCSELWLIKTYESITPGGFDIKNIHVKVYRK